MSDLPELPPTAGYVSDLANNASFALDDENDVGIAVYTRVQLLSFAREAMDRGRREGLEEAAKLADARVGQGGGRGWNQAMEHIADAIRAAVNPAKGN